MEISFDVFLKNFRGETVKHVKKEGEKEVVEDLSLKSACVEALMGVYQDEQALSGEDKIKRYALAEKIFLEGKVDLNAEDIALLKKLVAKMFSPVVVGPAWRLLEGK